ncbi:MAG TPA: FtsX-like permease family protein, partial [Chthoniobacterales bacterium]|nr:FtsX-like permease family protein [Chthoniobacterales bacterium]
ERELEIGFLIRRDSTFDPHFAAMDIGWAQELFERRGELSSIQLKLTAPSEREKVTALLGEVLPKDVRVAAPARRTQEVDKMLGGFQLNLAMMSLVSVLVGMFLIYNTVSASVVRRQHEIGILRSLGVTRTEIRMLFLSEAMVLGSIGSALGLMSGVALARFLIEAVSGTISSLYVLISVRDLALPPTTFALAFVVGLGSVALSAWYPAQAAAKQEPVEALHGAVRPEKSVTPSSVWLAIGFSAILLAAISCYLALFTGPRWVAFAAAFWVLAGFSFLVPRAIFHFSRGTRALLRWVRSRNGKGGIESELAATNLSRSLPRNSVTVAALAVAVAMTVGVMVMIFSYRKTVETWINQTLLADLFVTPASNEVAGAAVMPPRAVQFLFQHPSVETADTFREIEMPVGDTTAIVAVITGARRKFQFLRGDPPELMRRFRENACVFVSESFATRRHLGEGDVLELPTPDGPRQFPIAAIFYDYTRDQGVVYMSAANFEKFWHDDRVNSVALYLKNGRSGDDVEAALRDAFKGEAQFAVFSNQALRKRVFEIFDQTFAVTHVLLGIAIFVAITGIFLSLTILITERRRELAILRALGASAGQVMKLLLSETAMLGLLATLVGMSSGVCLALVLTGVVNRVFFGWTIHLAFPWPALSSTPVWILAAAVAAGIIPAWRASRMALADNLRDE